jgi:hypothetical protein
MSDRSEDLMEIHATLFVSPHDLRALKELGQRLALEGEPIAIGVTDRTAVDLAVNFIVGANLWDARQALGLPGEHV